MLEGVMLMFHDLCLLALLFLEYWLQPSGLHLFGLPPAASPPRSGRRFTVLGGARPKSRSDAISPFHFDSFSQRPDNH